MIPDFKRFHAFAFRGTNFLLDIPNSCLYELSSEAFDLFHRLKEDGESPESEAMTQLFEIFTRPAGEEDTSIAPRLERDMPPQNLLWLGLTHNCNLRCSYCFVDLEQSPLKTMSFSTAQAGIDRLIADSGERRDLDIIFFGGEPLLEVELLENIVTYCHRRGKECDKQFRFNITTNGMLLTPELFARLDELGVAVMVSLDGDQAAHDKLRRTRSNGPTWQTIINNITAIPGYAQNIAIRATITSEAPDYLRVYRTLEELGFQSIFLTEVCPGPQQSEQLRENLEILQKSYLDLMDYLFEQAMQTGSVAMAKLYRFLDALYSRRVSYYGCATGLNGYYLAPNGSYYPCNRLITPSNEFLLGNIHDGFDDNKRRVFLRNHVFNKPCKDCWARFLCGGQCYADSFWASNDLFMLDSFSCEMIRFKIITAAHFLSRLHAQQDIANKCSQKPSEIEASH